VAILLLAAAMGAHAQQLGTLFHSPAEREALDKLRRGDVPGKAAESIPLPDPVVTGFVKRSDGKSTVFIDKRPYPARDPRVQGVLDPRIVERYEPVPLPPAPEPAAPTQPDPAKSEAEKAPESKAASGGPPAIKLPPGTAKPGSPRNGKEG
jgi:hypothetical protein